MVRGVVVPYVPGGIVAAVTLGLGRALGEAIAVTQVIGNSLRPFPISLFGQGNTLASQLASSYQSAPTNIELSSLVYLGLILLVITFTTNLIAQRIVHRFDAQQRVRDDSSADLQTGPPSLRATGRSRRRLIVNYVAMGAAIASALLAVGMLAVLVGSVFVRGLPALNWDFFTKGPAVFGETGGGIAPAIVGTVMLVADRDRDRHPDRGAGRDLRQRVRAASSRRAGEALARRPERLSRRS